MSTIIRFGLDIAKNSFAVFGVDEREQPVCKKSLRRSQLLEFFANTPPAVIAMEAGTAAHHWARELQSLGHDARIIDARRVAPYRSQGNAGKNDLNDAAAICEAAGRPNMHFIPVKSAEQQAILTVHRMRSAAVAEHNRIANQLRGLLSEFGIVIAKGVHRLKAQWPEIRQRYAGDLPQLAWHEFDRLFQRLNHAHHDVLAYDRKLSAFVRNDVRAQRLSQMTGIGTVTASALVASVADAAEFKNGRQFAAWLGLTPRQNTTGGKPRLGRISKRGNVYLRTLLMHDARSELNFTATRSDGKSLRAESLKQRMSWNKAAVALVNKHARIAWAILAHDQPCRPTWNCSH